MSNANVAALVANARYYNGTIVRMGKTAKGIAHPADHYNTLCSLRAWRDDAMRRARKFQR
jgi:hypothetical protein